MLSRRRFLRASAAATVLAATGGLDRALAAIARGATARAAGYGPLVPDPARLLDLPAGFRYVAFSTAPAGGGGDARFQQQLANGDPVPAMHDGMGAFPDGQGGTILVRNHELEPGLGPAVDPAQQRRYDPLALGGTTTLHVDRDRRLTKSFASLSGTWRNCAGGVTPWGTWLTCEECVYLPGAPDTVNADRRPDAGRPHGYVFEVPARAEGLVEPVPILAMGRFYHEAVAVDAATGFVYLSEDRDDGLFYRFRPAVLIDRTKTPRTLAAGDLARGGVLEALKVRGRPQAKLQNWTGSATPVGARLDVEWVAVPAAAEMDMERDPTDPNPDPVKRRSRTSPRSIRARGFELGAAQFARVEGLSAARRAIYFCCTNGGAARAGQVWKLDTAASRLTLMVEPGDRALLDGPDNLVAAPNGDIVVCEDGFRDDFVVGITPAGRIYPIARNAHNQREMAGACFSADGRTMFVNLQEPGVTFAIWGPWERRRG